MCFRINKIYPNTNIDILLNFYEKQIVFLKIHKAEKTVLYLLEKYKEIIKTKNIIESKWKNIKLDLTNMRHRKFIKLSKTVDWIFKDYILRKL